MDSLLLMLASLSSPSIVMAAGAGVMIGIIGGALPGISASITMALVLPFTIAMEPTAALVLLASTYVGAEYGGSIPAILIRTPGTNAAAATAIDGYEMHRKGLSGEALGLSLMAGVIGGMIGLLCLAAFSPLLADLALWFTAPAYFSLGIFGLSVIASVSKGTLLSGLAAAVFGLMIATVGTDPFSGAQRFTFGSSTLIEGIKPIVVMVGVFALSELMAQANQPAWERATGDVRLKLPRVGQLWGLRRPIGIGSGLGIVEGVTPGVGGTVAAFLSYNEARRWSDDPDAFGRGSPEGIVAPEAANNTVACTAIIPTLSFGIPGSNSTAILLGGLMLHGLRPGPLLFQNHPDLVYGMFGGLLAANLLMIPIGFLILTPCIWIVNRPKPLLLAGVLALVVSGAFALEGSALHLLLVVAFGLIGYFFRWAGVPVLPLVLGLVLGYLVESNFRRSMLLSGGDPLIFVTDPISCILLVFTALSFAVTVVRGRKRRRVESTG